MKILVHICCAPCAVYPFYKLKHDFEEVMGDYFSSTLFLSPHQDQELLKTVIETISKKYRIKPYLERIEGGWQKGIELSKKMKLYRQEYCGCIYSEEERYRKKYQEKKNR